GIYPIWNAAVAVRAQFGADLLLLDLCVLICAITYWIVRACVKEHDGAPEVHQHPVGECHWCALMGLRTCHLCTLTLLGAGDIRCESTNFADNWPVWPVVSCTLVLLH